MDERSFQGPPADISRLIHLHPALAVPTGIPTAFPLAHSSWVHTHVLGPAWQNSLITFRMTVMAAFSSSESALQAALGNLTPGKIGIETNTHTGN